MKVDLNMKEISTDRWAFENIDSAILMLEKRHLQKISCVIDPLGEYSKTEQQAQESFKSYSDTIKKLSKIHQPSSMAVKPSAIGLNFNRHLASDLLLRIFEESTPGKINIEIDIEGTPTVEAICQLAADFSKRGFQTTLALQAYLKRTSEDIKMALASGIRVRLVKGAYKGDVDDFVLIQQMFLKCFNELKESAQPFDVGTHDPELLQQITSGLNPDECKKICFGFLKGLADQTKTDMAEKGFTVSEYIPFGNNRKAYETRRLAYLGRLSDLKRKPAP